MKNTNTNKALVEALVYNNRFASAKIDGEQIGVEAFSEIGRASCRERVCLSV